MLYCSHCNRHVSENFHFCPYCGKELGERFNPFNYILEQINFSYDKVEECSENGSFLGLKVWEGKKCGFLTYWTRGLPCEYDYIKPVLNTSPYPECCVRGAKLVYVVGKDNKYGIISFSPSDKFLNRDTQIIFNHVSIIRDYPACYIVDENFDEQQPSKLSFYDINLNRRILSSQYAEVARVYNHKEPQRAGIFFACSLDRTRGGYCDIVDLVKKEIVEIVCFDFYDDSNNTNWKTR